MSASYDSAYIVLSNRSYVDVHEEMLRRSGIESESINDYRKELQNHYLYVINKYYNKDEKGE